ncbi:SRPBCC family protein [Archangium minus]|uniref:SRPBCC family protein n=1 Tax=Archangium minus TaxID=83450 RepID=A0ABY9X9E5_9BACT|nr:SRPBCC family protein [Archangium violaceum]WNG52012.1 SRPBCC family protein [Archangium minus]
MAIKIGIVVVLVLIVGVFAFISTRPENFRVERSAQINAPAEVVFALINDFHQWGQWSPYEKLDPNMTKSFEGPVSGPGASYAWSGDKSGAGRMTIVESKPGERVSLKLEFFKPFEATNMTTFTLVTSGTGTRVSWVMEGKNSVMAKALSAFMDMDAMVGKDFEQGLAHLDTAAQAEARKLGQTAAASVP